jgi:hypothetical protein
MHWVDKQIACVKKDDLPYCFNNNILSKNVIRNYCNEQCNRRKCGFRDSHIIVG